jgi:hypothetical protein
MDDPAPPDQTTAPKEPPRSPSGPARQLLVIGVAILVVSGGAIAIAAVAAGGSGKRAEPAASAAPSPSPIVVAMPVSVLATPDFKPYMQVVLSWVLPEDGPEVTRVEVFRGSDRIGNLVATSTSLTDLEVDPGESYSYSIVAISGERRSSPAIVEVSVPVPAMSDARLEGNYNMTAKATSHSGYLTLSTKMTLDWFVDSKCHDGPCDAVVEMTGLKTITIRLHRDGTRYTGTVKGRFNVKCGNILTTSTIAIDVRVVKAAPHSYFGSAGRPWLATKLTGTFTHVEAPQLGCGGSQAQYDITVTR